MDVENNPYRVIIEVTKHLLYTDYNMAIIVEVVDWMKYSSSYLKWLRDNNLSETKARTALEVLVDTEFNCIRGYTTEEVCEAGNISYKGNQFKRHFQLFIENKVIKKVNKRWYINPKLLFKGYDWHQNECYKHFEAEDIPSNLSQEILRRRKAAERLQDSSDERLVSILK